MAKQKRLTWIEIARRGKAQPLLVIDTVIDLYRQGYFAKAHNINWNPQNYRQFDNARWFESATYEKYKAVMEKASRAKKIDLLYYAEEFNRRITAHRLFVKRHKDIDFKRLANGQLAKIFQAWIEHHKRFWSFAYDYIFINKFLPDIITSVLSAKVENLNELNYYFTIFFEADQSSEMRMEKKSLVAIARNMREKKLTVNQPLIAAALKRHLKKFAHLGFYYFRGSAYTPDSLKSRLKEYLDMKKPLFKKMREDFRTQEQNKALVARAIRKLNLDKQTVYWIRCVKRWGSLSNYVDETYGFAVHNLMPFLKEISQRLGVPYNHFYSLTAEEITMGLRRGGITESLKIKARERHQDHALILYNRGKLVLSGQELKPYRAKERRRGERVSDVKILKGITACQGFARGRVKIIFTTHDIKKVERGNILIASATNPTYVPAMEKAGAIVTDEGGLLSHAAIVGRELKIPCVVGVKIATKVLRDGDLVEVDADKGRVRILKRKNE